jgi:serine/threonine protein kinase/WD40 repeat protein
VADSLLIDQRRRWEQGERVLVESYLEDQPGLRGDTDRLLELIEHEITLREEEGETPQLEEYLRRFPELARDLRLHFEVHAALRADREWAATVPKAKGSAVVDRPVLPGYEVLGELGRGGMGIVYRARQIGLNRLVAVKMILTGGHAGPQEVARFRREAEAVAQLQHPHIVQIYEVGESEGRPYLALEYVDGGNLDHATRHLPQPAEASARFVEALARAMHYAHQRGVIHRDLKPANILLAVDSSQLSVVSNEKRTLSTDNWQLTTTPKITDFGLAKLLGPSATGPTLTGELLGTPSYMAPEQAQGKIAEIGPATDIWALGVILYELLTGHPPFQADSALETLVQVRFQEPVSPSRLQPKLPRDVVTICLACLQKDPRKRYASAEKLAEDLRRFLDGKPIGARPVGRTERVLRWCRRKPVLAGLLAAVILLVGVVAVGGPVAAIRIAGQRDLAEERTREANEELWKASLQQARAERRSGQVRQRLACLEALTRAAAIRPSLELRNEAIACLALPDLRLVRRWTGEPRFEVALAFDPQFQRYAQKEGDTIAVRQVSDDRVLLSRPSPGAFDFAGFSGDGRYLAFQYFGTQRREPYLYVWDLNRQQTVLDVLCPGGFALSPDSRRVAVPQGGTGLAIYELESGKEIRRLGKISVTGWMAYHPREPLLAIEGTKGTMEIWAVDTGKLVTTLDHPRELGVLTWGDSGRLLVVGMEEGTIYVWEVASWRRLAVLRGHRGTVVRLFSHPTQNVLVSGAWDDTTRLWDPRDGRQLLVAPGLVEGVRADGGQLAIRLGDQLEVWELILPTECRTLLYSPSSPLQREVPYHGPWGMAYHPRGQLLASGGEDGVRLWDPLTGQERAYLAIEAVAAVLFHSSGTRLISYGKGGLRSWTLRCDPGAADDGLPLGPARLLEAPRNSPWHRRMCCWCPGERSLALIANEGERLVVVQPFEVAGEVVTFKGRPSRYTSVAVSPDGRWLAAGAWNDFGITIWELATGQVVKELPGSRDPPIRTNVEFSPDGKWLVAGGQGEYRFWRVGSWEAGLVIPRSHLENRPGYMAFTRDGKVLAIAWSRDQVRLVNAADGEELATLTSPDPRPITKICFRPDENQLAVAAENYVIHLWDLRGLRAQLAGLGLDWESPP